MKLIKRISLLPVILLFVLHVSASTFVASINSDVYHISSCGQAGKIKSDNLITFQSAEAAEASGRHPCSFCLDEISRSRKTSPQPTVSATAPVSSVAKSTESPSSTPAPIAATGPPPKNYITDPVTKPASTASSGFPNSSILITSLCFILFHLYNHFSHKRTIRQFKQRINELEIAYQYQLELNQKSVKAEKEFREALEESQKQLSNSKSVYESYYSDANKALTDRINELTSSLEESNRNHKEFLECMRQSFGNDFLLQASGAPKGTYWDEYGYPRRSASSDSDPYMLHRSSTGRFHTSHCSHSHNCIPVHALDVSKEEFYINRCQVCKPEYPDLSWEMKYRHLYKLTK